jgi:hypothetical protein
LRGVLESDGAKAVALRGGLADQHHGFGDVDRGKQRMTEQQRWEVTGDAADPGKARRVRADQSDRLQNDEGVGWTRSE